ncbi:MAG: hypothetical protein V1752_07780 [Candidatus Firestonebacteria bacterium]
MQKLFLFLFCAIIFAGCGGTAKTVKAATLPVKYNIGLSENFDGDIAPGNVTEMVVKELTSCNQVKFVDRRKIKSAIAGQAALLAEGPADNIKLGEPMQYIITGSVIPLGSKMIVRLSLLNVQTSATESSITFEYKRAEEIPGKIKAAVLELMQRFSGQTYK